MTRTLTLVLVLALPVLAEEKKATASSETTATTAAAATAAAAKTEPRTQAQPAQADSPLVAAAKRTNRLGKKPTNVITNATLKTSGESAHVTTTTTQTAIKMPRPLEPPRDTPEMAHAKMVRDQRQKAVEQAEKDRKAKEEQQRKTQEAAAAAEEGYDGMQDDAAEFTGPEAPPPQF